MSPASPPEVPGSDLPAMPDVPRARRIRYDGAQSRRDTLAALDSLREQLLVSSRAGGVGPAVISRLRGATETLRQRAGRPLQLMVVGDFKRGKSTLVNALVGAEVVTMDVTPETVTITELVPGKRTRAELRLEGGGVVSLDANELQRDRLEPILDNLPAPVDHLRIEAPLELLDRVTIVDTPGMGDLTWQFDRRVQRQLPEADVVLYVVSALSPLSETERAFLTLSLRPLDLSKVVFVVNMVDQIRKEGDVDRLVYEVRSRLTAHFPDSPVFALSALDELCRVLGEERPRPRRTAVLEASFARLRRYLDEVLEIDQDLVRTERLVFGSKIAVAQLRTQLDHTRAALSADGESLARTVAQARDSDSEARQELGRNLARLRADVVELGHDAQSWVDGFIDRLELEVLPKLVGADHAVLQRHFPFFLASSLRDAVVACLDHHQPQLSHRLEELSADSGLPEWAEASKKQAQDQLQQAADAASTHSPAFASTDNLHVLTMISAMLVPVLYPLGVLVAGVVDVTSADAERASAWRQEVSKAMPELRSKCAAQVAVAYEQLADAACEAVSTHATGHLERLAEVAEQALLDQQSGDAHLADVRAALHRQSEMIDTVEGTLDTIEGRLADLVMP